MILEEKQRLRGRMRAMLRDRVAESVRPVLEAWEVWTVARRVCGYWPLRGEAPWQEPWPSGKELALPRVDGERVVAYWVRGIGELTAGAFGILEPAPEAPSAGKVFDLILVPGLAFDRHGGRLGRGRGYYDRFLPGCRGMRVGVCLAEQVVPHVPVEPHDARMDYLLTPDGVIVCAKAEAQDPRR